MAKSNRDRVGTALDHFVEGFMPFVERQMEARHGDQWKSKVEQHLGNSSPTAKKAGRQRVLRWDAPALVHVINREWQYLFSKKLGKAERGMLNEVSDIRNRWAHQEAFSLDDTIRALDTIDRVLQSVSASEEAGTVEKLKQEVMRTRFADMQKRETKRAQQAAASGEPMEGLTPWREVVTPHPDVATGRYALAEFAADLARVVRDPKDAGEYGEPKEFFRRTFLTEGLQRLLVSAVKRLSGTGGDPVIELQTNFGGGKTHSMLALYHLFGQEPAGNLTGVDSILAETGIEDVPKTNRAVLVGTASSPGDTEKKEDGTELRTLWGRLAWQLLGRQGYDMVAKSDEAGVSPGSDDLVALFNAAGPTLILIDEWVAFCRQLYDTSGLPGGSFDANMTFAQALTEAVKASSQTLLVATLPSSDIEIGGEGGRQALTRLSNTFGRSDTNWQPAGAEESYEIVRRRLFESISDPKMYAARDAVIRAFSELYQKQSSEFPSECRERDYERLMQISYPIHPELFVRLYQDWSALERFQRTRGVLRLMAKVIWSLWDRQDRSLMIMPSMIPLDEAEVQAEITNYLGDHWRPVIEKDVDGLNSLPQRLDKENPNFGRYSAARRASRTIYMGSAPIADAARRGADDRQIKLGCVQPGESVGTFGDALRRLTDQATHLYVDDNRYWFSTQPNVTRMAEDRALQKSEDEVHAEIKRRIRDQQKHRGEFAKVHPTPAGSAEIPDEEEARLVILGPDTPHVPNDTESPAKQCCRDMLTQRGSTPRIYRNTLVFLAVDKTRAGDLDEAVRQYLAWVSIDDEQKELNLDEYQRRQANSKRKRADETVAARLPEAYQWLLVPDQSNPQGEIEWQELRQQGQDWLASRAATRLTRDSLLLTRLAGAVLKLHLDNVPLWRNGHVRVKQLMEDFAQYLYLPRLKKPELIATAVQDGVQQLQWRSDTFAYASSYDKERDRYVGLRAGEALEVVADDHSVVVRPEVAAEQLDNAEAASPASGEHTATTAAAGTGAETRGGESGGNGEAPGIGAQADTKVTRFYGSVDLTSTRMGRDAGKVAEEVVQHLTGLVGSDIKITLEIEAEVPDGIEERVQNIIRENCRTLRFRDFDFPEE